MRRYDRTSLYQVIAGLVSAWLACLPVLPAQNPVSFESTGPEREVTEGSRFEVSFTLKNASGKRFIAPDFKGFRVTGGPVEMRGAGFVNGQSYSHQTWSFELEAGKPGIYTIGPATVQTSAQTLRSQPLSIRVTQAKQSRTNAPPNARDNVFVSGELDRSTIWIGQQVRYQIKLYTQLSIAGFDIIDLPPFKGFYALDRRRFDTRTQYETIRGKRYAVRVLHEVALFPQESGELLIEASRVRVDVEQAGGLGSLLGATPVLMQTQPIRLTVNPLPDPAPEDFTGGVGHYQWKISTDKDSLSTDDALTLTVTIEGNGDARRFANPRFELPAGLEGFEPKVREEEEYETGEQWVHARTLEYVILPKEPGDYKLSPQFAVFDADSNRYHVLQAGQALHFRVTAGKLYGQEQALTDTLATPPPLESPLVSFWRTTKTWLMSPLLWGSALGLALITGVLLFWKNHRKKPLDRIPDKNPAQVSLKEARERFNNAAQWIHYGDPKAFFHELLKSLESYLAIRLQIEPAQLSKEVLQEKLTERRAPEPLIQALWHVWQTCEQAVFAGQAHAGEVQATWQKAESSVQQLEDFLKR